MHVRGIAIADLNGIATMVGAVAPAVFGAIVDSGDPSSLFSGYLFASALMLGAAILARILGVASEGRSLEELSQ